MLTPTRRADIHTLVHFYTRQGAHKNGARIAHAETARQLGWFSWRVDNAIRAIKNHPELGIGITCRRGSQPRVILTSRELKLSGREVVGEDLRILRAGMIEGTYRIARYYSQTKNNYAGLADKTTQTARRFLNEQRRQELALRSLQASLDQTSLDEATAVEFIDRVLS